MDLIHLKKLDIVLQLLKEQYDKHYPNVFIALIYSGTSHNPIAKFSLEDISLILNKLVNDGYVNRNELKDVGVDYHMRKIYTISLEGLIFLEQGGYVMQVEKDKRNKAINKAITVAGGVAAIYYLFEILSNYIEPIWQHACNCQFIWQK